MLILRNINIPLDFNGDYKSACAAELRTSSDNIAMLRIIRKSVDARKKYDIHFVYSFEICVNNDEQRIIRGCKKAESAIIDEQDSFMPARDEKKTAPIIIGSGPAGIFCALELIAYGYRPILIERGKPVNERTDDVELFWKNGKLNTSSNVQFGEGGAGTFSDGKLNTGTNSPFRMKVLRTFVKFGAPEDILYDAEPHIGTDLLRNVIENIRAYIVKNGGKYLFSSQLVDFDLSNGRVASVRIKNGDDVQKIDCDSVVLAIGHSARDTFEMLRRRGVAMEAKPFSVGVRIEHLQSDINKARYGSMYANPALSAASYRLSSHVNGRGVYTFCMCPGGVVVNAASEENSVVTNGMSYRARDLTNANSAVLVGVTPDDFGSDDPLAGVRFQRSIEQKAYLINNMYKAPAQSLADYKDKRITTRFDGVQPSCKGGVTACDINDILPEYVNAAIKLGIADFGCKIKGFDNGDAVLTAPETRSSSPVRIVRDDSFQSNIDGLYPCGEGAGYAGGITSSAVDGIRVARAIMAKR